MSQSIIENSEEKVIDYFKEKMAEVMKEEVEKAYDLGVKRGIMKGMRRHTWTKDGVVYVGSGMYTIKDAIRMAKMDGVICEDEK